MPPPFEGQGSVVILPVAFVLLISNPKKPLETAGLGWLTEKLVLPVTPHVAVIFVVPALSPVERPAATVATPVAEEAHVAVAVRSLVVPSAKVPTAVNCTVFPTRFEADPGL